MEEEPFDLPPAPPFHDLVEFLNEKVPGFACLVCKSKELEIARQRLVKGKIFRPAITFVGPHGPFQMYSFYTSCSNCGAVQMFDLRAFRQWKEKRKGKGDNPAPPA